MNLKCNDLYTRVKGRNNTYNKSRNSNKYTNSEPEDINSSDWRQIQEVLVEQIGDI